MRVLLVSEGKHELGAGGDSGALAILLRRMSSDVDNIECRRFKDLPRGYYGKGGRLFRRAMDWLIEAQKRGFDALVIVVDQDGKDKRLRDFEAVQSHLKYTVKRALGIAVQKFDAWMLADESALTEVLGHPVNRQPDVESIRRPKVVCNALLDQSETAMSLTEMYARLAKRANLDVLVERAPRGFAPFAERVRQL